MMYYMRCPKITNGMAKAVKPIVSKILYGKSQQPNPPQIKIQIEKTPIIINQPKHTQRKQLCERVDKQVPNPHG